MKADLHLHSNASDGAHSPAEVTEFCRRANVGVMSLTDHDTTAGLDEAAAAARLAGIRFLRGVEISSQWAGRSVHVVALGVPQANGQFEDFLAHVRALRLERSRRIGAKFAEIGIPGAWKGAVSEAGGPENLSRTHFALWLLHSGGVAHYEDAFERYLGAGGPCAVPRNWPQMEEVVSFIRACGAEPVLAHPGRYRLEVGWQEEALVDAFCGAGGRSIEVASGSQSEASGRRFAEIARRRGLYASVGSDWHSERSKRPMPGTVAQVPSDLTPVWSLFFEDSTQS